MTDPVRIVSIRIKQSTLDEIIRLHEATCKGGDQHSEPVLSVFVRKAIAERIRTEAYNLKCRLKRQKRKADEESVDLGQTPPKADEESGVDLREV